jgi:hypothetical protein
VWRIVGSFSFLFAQRVWGKLVRYNDTRYANKRATSCNNTSIVFHKYVAPHVCFQ